MNKIDKIKNEVLETLRKAQKYLSINYLANKTGYHWTTIQAVAVQLEREGIVKTLNTKSGLFVILKMQNRPLTCGECIYFNRSYCKVYANYDVHRTQLTPACKHALAHSSKLGVGFVS